MIWVGVGYVVCAVITGHLNGRCLDEERSGYYEGMKPTRTQPALPRDRGVVDASQIFFILGAIVLVGFIVLWVAGRN